MHIRRTTIGMTALTVCALTMAVACSAGDDTDRSVSTPTVEDAASGLPKAPPIKLPDFWNGMGGGVFEFAADDPSYTTDKIISVGNSSTAPTLWTWGGESTVLNPVSDGEIKTGGSYIVNRDGRPYVVTLWTGKTAVSGNTLGDAKTAHGLTTWDDTGAVVFHGERVDQDSAAMSARVALGAKWKQSDGYLVQHLDATVIDNVFQDGELLLDPLTGKSRVQPIPNEKRVQATVLNEALTATGTWEAGDTVTLTNSKTGTVTTLTPDQAKCGGSAPKLSAVKSSFDGRYIVIGQRVVDTTTQDSSCLDKVGGPSLTAIASTGIAYGTASQNGSKVVISYDFETKAVTVLPDAMVAPDFVGPDDIAVVAPKVGGNRHFGVYRTSDR